MKRTSIKIVLFAILISSITACGSKGTTVPRTPEYPVMTLDTMTAVTYTEYSTIIQSNTVVEVRSKVSGYLTEIAKEEGSFVKKGDLIFKIDDADYRQQVKAAEAAMEAAKAKENNVALEIRKLTPLVEKGIISAFELETAKSNLEAAKANYNQTKANYENTLITLKYTEIKSGVNGILGRIYVREGSLISPSMQDPLTTISSEGDVSAYFSYDEKKLTPARKKNFEEGKFNSPDNAVIELIMPNGTAYHHKGRLASASGIIDRTTGSIQLKVIFPNPDMEILTGNSGVLRFPMEYHGCIVIPQSATYELQNKTMIFIVNEDNTVNRKSINIEGVSGNNYVVNNIPAGTRIVTEGIDKLKEGMKIIPKEK